MKTSKQKILYHINQIRKAIEEEPEQTFDMYCLWQQTDSMHEILTGKRFHDVDHCIICPNCGKKVNK